MLLNFLLLIMTIIIIGSNAMQYGIIDATPMNSKFPYEENQQKAMQNILS